MSIGFGQLTHGQLVGVIESALTALADDRLPVPTDADQMELLLASLRLDARLRAWQAKLAASIDQTDAAWREHGTSTATWLADASRLTRREAGRIIAAGDGLARFPDIGDAALRGDVLPAQAEAITGVLSNLPEDLPGDTVRQAQRLMVGFAATHNSSELRRLSGRLLETLAPETADELEAARLEREHRLAQRNRYLRFTGDHHGSILIRGSLPVADAEPLIRIIDAYAAAQKRGDEEADPDAEFITPAMRCADALLAMVHRHAQQALAPGHGGDRPRVVVTMSHDKLLQTAADDGLLVGRLLGGGEPIASGVLRQWLCDADLMPVVLGGASEVLDVGRTRRLVTPAIRAALEVRDGGCVFPGCDRFPADCHAHHLVPWWAGGATALGNLVLLCPHHHGIIEPGRNPDADADRWLVRLGCDGVAEVIPPRRVDAEQRPRVNVRLLSRRRE